MSPGETSEKLTFAQGLQLFFVQRILEEHTMSTFFGDDKLNNLLMQWSQIVRAGLKQDPKFLCSVKVPEKFGKIQVEARPRSAALLDDNAPEGPEAAKKGALDLSFVPEKYREAYRPILENSDFSPFLPLLDDDDLGRLMQVEYTTQLAHLAKVTAPAPKTESKDADIVREAIARQLKKKPDELTEDDYKKIKALDLAGSGIADLTPLEGLQNLQTLSFSGTQVADIGPLQGLQNLQELFLHETSVSDLEPLRNLTALVRLGVHQTGVSDLEPLRNLTGLQALDLNDTKVSDVEPLGHLTSLLRLYLSGTQVADLEGLAGLQNLQELFLHRTFVSNLEHLRNLTALVRLGVHQTGVSDLQPLQNLTLLQALDLEKTKVSDVKPLGHLTSLLRLYLSGTQVADLGPLAGLQNLQWLYLSGTKVSDEQVAELEKALPKLRIYR